MLKETENQSEVATSQVAPLASQLTARHYKECTEKRGLNPQWVLANCLSVIANYATQYLGYTAKSDGIWLKGCNHQSQFKPDKPWKKEGDKKAAKYRSPLGEYDAMLPTHPTNPHYWDDIETLKKIAYKIEGHPCLFLTEGFFTAIAGCSNGIPTIALLGVEMGLTPKDADPQGKRYLVKTLEHYARAGFGFIIGLDADCATNKSVIEAQRKLVHQLKLFKVPLYNATGLWTVAEGKGMDDYIQNHGGDRFKREVLGKVVDITAWKKQIQTPETHRTGKLQPADIVGRSIIEDYRDRLLWNDEQKTWMYYSLEREGVWTPISDLYLESVVDAILESKGIIGYGSASYVTNVVAKMRRRLFERVWDERSISEILPFTDGVLELATGQFHQHAPGYRLTWCLPRPYNSIATGWTAINNWLSEATGNEAHKEILLCFAAAVLRGRSDLHKFLHLIGIGGSGKSTFTRLLEALIGSQNCWNGSLIDLEDKHSVAMLIGKRLVILPDQDKVTGSLSNFKRLTGQDTLSGRRLYKDGLNFRFPGMAVVTSNSPIFHADGGSWLTRRILMLAFDHKPSSDKVRDLEAEFEPELSAFTNYLLSIPNDEITRVLRRIGKDGVSPTLWQAKIRTDSIAAWVNEWVIHEPAAKTQIGCDRSEWADKDYNPDISTLFGSYSHYCRVSGLQAKGKNNFSSDLIELCQQTLSWGDVNYDRDNFGRRLICSLRLRTDGDTTPTLEDSLTTDNPSDSRSDNPSDNLKPFDYRESDNPDNLLLSKLVGTENELSAAVVKVDEDTKSFGAPPIKEPEPPIESTAQVVSEGCQQVVSEVVSQPDAANAPTKAPQPPQRELAPATPTRQPQVFRVSDRTHYSGAKGAMAVTCRGKELEVLNTRINDEGEQECEIKASGWCASYWVLSRSLKKVKL
jgi:putative DNA primase/helicase